MVYLGNVNYSATRALRLYARTVELVSAWALDALLLTSFGCKCVRRHEFVVTVTVIITIITSHDHDDDDHHHSF
jgi:hypothetical protein